VAYWTASTDPESGILYYTYAIGSQPGLGDIRWWQVVGNITHSYASSLAELNVAEDTVVYYSVMAHNGAGLSSDIAPSGPITLGWSDLGNPADSLVVELSTYGFDSDGTTIIAGWDSTNQFLMNHFIERMKPIITEIYGSPSHTYTVTLVRNLRYASSNVFLSGPNEVHMGAFYPQLLTHELIHAYRDNVVVASDSLWRYNPHLSGFEESFAQGVSYLCMNRYIELYPADIIVDSTYLYGSGNDWDYDFQNTPAITTQDFWSDAGGTGIFYLRYELGAAAVRKIHIEDPDFFKNWNAEYYARLNADHALVPTRDLMLGITAAVISQVEGTEIVQWLGTQRIFDCTVQTGKKIWVKTQHYPGTDYWIFNRILYYETFSNGSEWSFYDTQAGEWVYHSLNGSMGTATVTQFDGSQLWQGSQLIEPIDNPPVYFGFGESPRTFGTASTINPWPGGDPADFLLNMTDLDLYTLHIQFDTTEISVYRVIGNELNNSSGVWGAVIGSSGGMIYLDHDGMAPEPAIPVVNGAFWGTRQWASVVNSATGSRDSRPGKIFVRYVRPDGQAYLAQRNVDWGSSGGNQQFLFDTALMVRDSSTGCIVVVTGDVNESGSITSADIIHMVNYVFKSGPAPLPLEAAGDVNCSGNVSSADIVFMVNFVFKSGSLPCDVCTIL